MSPDTRRRELLVVAAVAALLPALWLAKPWHIDEPFFLAIARQILSDPRRPLAFAFDWYGTLVPMASINNTPPLWGYVLAGTWALTDGGEAAMRLLLLPLNAAAALGAYLLAARFLRRPLLPTLILIASPAWSLPLQHLMPEKLLAAFAFPGLYALVRGVDERDGRWFWGSALLLALALLSKYNAVLLLPPALVYAWRGGAGRTRTALWAALALSGAAVYALADASGAALRAAAAVTEASARLPTSAWTHKSRSLLAFLGGCGLVTAFWTWLLCGRRAAALALLGAAALFLPALDLLPGVRAADRLLGLFLAAGAALGLWRILLEARGSKAGAFWAVWAFGGLLLQSLYWSVMARFTLFLLPPLVFGLAAQLEERWSQRRLAALHAAGLAAVLAFGAGLSAVDYRYAAAQKEASVEAARLVGEGRRVFFTGHWGLQFYMERAGARALEKPAGWNVLRRGDVAVVPAVNSNILRPSRPMKADVRVFSVGHRLPLRLDSAGASDAGFHCDVTGFLPFAFSREPLDELSFVEIL